MHDLYSYLSTLASVFYLSESPVDMLNPLRLHLVGFNFVLDFLFVYRIFGAVPSILINIHKLSKYELPDLTDLVL